MIISVYESERKLDSYDLGELITSDFVESFSFLIGRSNECRILLPDKKVSRNHCEVIYKSKKWFLSKTSKYSDLSFNGKQIDEIEVTGDGVLLIGPYELKIQIPEKK